MFITCVDVRELHERCKIAVKHQTLCCTFDEWILNICEGEIPLSDNYLSHEKELYNRYLKEKKLNGGINSFQITKLIYTIIYRIN